MICGVQRVQVYKSSTSSEKYFVPESNRSGYFSTTFAIILADNINKTLKTSVFRQIKLARNQKTAIMRFRVLIF